MAVIKGLLQAGVLASVVALPGTAHAIKVEVWDVLAPDSGCCNGNPSYANQQTDRSNEEVNLGENTVLVPSGFNDLNDGVSDAVADKQGIGALDDYFDNTGAIFDPEGNTVFEAIDVDGVIASNVAPDVVFNLLVGDLSAGFSTNSVLGTTILEFFDNPVDIVSDNGAGDNSILGTVVRITGLAELAAGVNNFSVTSDDGYRITIGGVEVANETGLQAPTNKPHSVTVDDAGLFSFEMIWFEANVTQAALDIDLAIVPGGGVTPPVPLPAGVWLMGTALAGLGVASRRRRKTA